MMVLKGCFLTQCRNTFYSLSKVNDIIYYYTEDLSQFITISNNAILNKHVPIFIAFIPGLRNIF